MKLSEPGTQTVLSPSDKPLITILADLCKKMEIAIATTANFELFEVCSNALNLAYNWCSQWGVSPDVCQRVVSCVNDFFLNPCVINFADQAIVGAAVVEVCRAEGIQFGVMGLEEVSGYKIDDLVKVAYLLSRVYQIKAETPEKVFAALDPAHIRTRAISLTGLLVEKQARENMGGVNRIRRKKAEGRRARRYVVRWRGGG